MAEATRKPRQGGRHAAAAASTLLRQRAFSTVRLPIFSCGPPSVFIYSTRLLCSKANKGTSGCLICEIILEVETLGRIKFLLTVVLNNFSFPVERVTSSAASMPSMETPPTSHRLSRSKMSAQIPGVRSLNLSLKQVQKATRKFSPALKLSENAVWSVYKGILPNNQIVVVRRAKKVVSTLDYSLIFPSCVLVIYHFFLIKTCIQFVCRSLWYYL